MQLELDLVNGKTVAINIADFETQTEQQTFQMFLNHFRTNGWRQVSDDEAVYSSAVVSVKIVRKKGP
jgi:hypothetical protein